HHSRRVQPEQAPAWLAGHGAQPAARLRGLAVLHYLRRAAAPRQRLHRVRQGHERHGARRSHPPGRQDEVRHHHRGIAVPWSLLLRGGIVIAPDLQWETFGEYLDALRSVRPSVNVVHLVGHGALRIAAMGFEARPAGADDLRGMERLLGEAMDAGAWGFSTGLVYPPSA